MQNTSMLNVRNLASLNVTGRFLTRKAKVKLPRAKKPREPRTQKKAITEPLLHTMMRFLGSECESMSMKGGEVPNQVPQITTWIREQMGMTELKAPDSSRYLIVLPGFTALNAKITVMVLAKTVETVTVNTRANVTC